MPAAPEARKAAFAVLVKRALETAKRERGWSVPRIAQESGVGDSTIYRWRDGDWKRSPQPEQVVAFCDALGLRTETAFRILWPSRGDRPAEPDPAPIPPDVQEVLRRLRDPNVPEQEKYFIARTLSGLIGRTDDGRRQTG